MRDYIRIFALVAAAFLSLESAAQEAPDPKVCAQSHSVIGIIRKAMPETSSLKVEKLGDCLVHLGPVTRRR